MYIFNESRWLINQMLISLTHRSAFNASFKPCVCVCALCVLCVLCVLSVSATPQWGGWLLEVSHICWCWCGSISLICFQVVWHLLRSFKSCDTFSATPMTQEDANFSMICLNISNMIHAFMSQTNQILTWCVNTSVPLGFYIDFETTLICRWSDNPGGYSQWKPTIEKGQPGVDFNI